MSRPGKPIIGTTDPKVIKIIEQERATDRWENGVEHHPKSIELMKFIETLDFNAYGDYFCWKTGGDGDNGETLMYQMDAFFEAKDKGEI